MPRFDLDTREALDRAKHFMSMTETENKSPAERALIAVQYSMAVDLNRIANALEKRS